MGFSTWSRSVVLLPWQAGRLSVFSPREQRDTWGGVGGGAHGANWEIRRGRLLKPAAGKG